MLKFATVSFQQVSRLLAIPTSVFVDFAFWDVALPKRRRLAYVVGILLAAVSVLYEQHKLSFVAVAASVLATFAQVGSQMITKTMCRRHGVSALEVVRISSPYTLATSLATIALSSFYSKGKFELPEASLLDLSDIPVHTYALVALSCVLALLVQYLSTYLGDKCTGLSYSLLTLAKTLTTVCVGMLAFSERFDMRTLGGSGVALVLFALYLIES